MNSQTQDLNRRSFLRTVTLGGSLLPLALGSCSKGPSDEARSRALGFKSLDHLLFYARTLAAATNDAKSGLSSYLNGVFWDLNADDHSRNFQDDRRLRIVRYLSTRPALDGFYESRIALSELLPLGKNASAFLVNNGAWLDNGLSEIGQGEEISKKQYLRLEAAFRAVCNSANRARQCSNMLGSWWRKPSVVQPGEPRIPNYDQCTERVLDLLLKLNSLVFETGELRRIVLAGADR